MKSPLTLTVLSLSAVVWCTAGFAKTMPNSVFIMTDDQTMPLIAVQESTAHQAEGDPADTAL